MWCCNHFSCSIPFYIKDFFLGKTLLFFSFFSNCLAINAIGNLGVVMWKSCDRGVVNLKPNFSVLLLAFVFNLENS